MNLASCKAFFDMTGKDLPYTLMMYLEACHATKGMGSIERLRYYFGIETADVISKLFYCMIKQESPSIPLAEIQDAMHRVSWMPTDMDDSELCNPWPLVLVDLSTQVNAYYSQLDKKKVTT